MQTVLTAYAEQGIKLAIESKRVKHINFRIKSIDEAPFTSLLSVSYPMRMPQHLLMQSLEHRLAWAIDCQQKQRKLKQLMRSNMQKVGNTILNAVINGIVKKMGFVKKCNLITF